MSLLEWKITDGSFKNFSFHVATPNPNVNFGITGQDISVERRIQTTERALLDGGDVEDFGKKPRNFSVDVLFFGGDYQQRVKDFDAILNQGTTGKLILPDLDEAIYAKFVKYGRKTSAADGGTTLINVSFIEDRTSKAGVAINVDNLKLADAGLVAARTPQDIAAQSTFDANSVLSSVQNNEYLKKIDTQRTAINSVSATINQQVSALKQTIATVTDAKSGLQLAVVNFQATITSALAFIQQIFPVAVGAATTIAVGSYVSDLGASDFREPTSSVSTQTVASEELPTATFNKSFISVSDTIKGLMAAMNDLVTSNGTLEVATNGKSKDVSESNIVLINSIRDLIAALESTSSTAYLTTLDTSLLEVMFRNGIDVGEVQRIYKLNTQLGDPLYIPAMTVVYL